MLESALPHKCDPASCDAVQVAFSGEMFVNTMRQAQLQGTPPTRHLAPLPPNCCGYGAVRRPQVWWQSGHGAWGQLKLRKRCWAAHSADGHLDFHSFQLRQYLLSYSPLDGTNRERNTFLHLENQGPCVSDDKFPIT